MNYIGINKPGQSTIVMITVPVGAYYEPTANLGIAHFLEHMCFKGTKKRPGQTIDAEIENVGGEINAFTDWELTSYYAKVANRYTKRAMEALMDMVFNATFPTKEVDKERQVIIQEKKMYEDRPTSVAENLFYQSRYSNRFKIDIVGTENTLNRTQRKDLVAFRDRYYTKQNAIMIVVGAVDNQDSGYLPEQFKISQKSYLRELDGLRSFYIPKPVQQANLVIGNEAFISPKAEFALDVLDSVYNDMNGRLFKIIREKYSMVYGIRFGTLVRSNGHYEWQVVLGLDQKNIEKAHELIIKELTRPVAEKELKIAIQKTIGATALYLDSNIRLANVVNNRIRMGKNYHDINSFAKRYSQYTLKDINDLILQFNFGDHIIAGVVPEKK